MTWAMKVRDLLRQGREEGREEGIKALVVTLNKLSQTLDLAVQTVAERFNLSLKRKKQNNIGSNDLCSKKDCNFLFNRL